MSLEVWEQPDPRSAYVMGVDTAEGLGHGAVSYTHLTLPTTPYV